MRTLAFTYLLAVTSLLFFPQALSAQTLSRETIEEKARGMSPEEAERVLRQLGITQDEAIRRARALGIDVDQYLLRAAGGELAQPQARMPLDTLVTAPDTVETATPPEPPAGLADVPGFHGRTGVEKDIQPFGFEAFRYPPETFTPPSLVATPPNYALGPGDELIISLWGQTQLNYKVSVNREGSVVVPDVGPVSARGLSVAQFREKLLRRMSAIYSGLKEGAPGADTFLDVSLGKLKTVQVLVLGEVRRPGGYVLSSMSTVLQALYVSGGPRVDGSLRDVRLVRQGESPRHIDLYTFMLGGARPSGTGLQDGDVVFVPPASKRIAVVGEIVRPAIYELADGEVFGDLVRMAGGLRFSSYTDRVHIERIVPFEQRDAIQRDILDFDLWFHNVQELRESTHRLVDGDVVTFYSITSEIENRVWISGNVNMPGPFELVEGMRVGDLIRAADSLQRSTFGERGTIYRSIHDGKRKILAFNPRLALLGDARENVPLVNEDSVVVYPLTDFEPQRSVTIAGAVRNPGSYPRDEAMTLSDLVISAGGLIDGASLRGWEVARLDTTTLGVYRTVTKVDAREEYWNGVTGDSVVFLEDYDAVFIPSDPRFSLGRTVRVTGYVMYPGSYTLRTEEERVGDVLRRAGGLRGGAYLAGSRLYRKFNNAGLVPLDFAAAIQDSLSEDNIVLYDGDSIHVSRIEQVVYVNGEVYVPSPVLYKQGESLDYYIYQAGDFTQDAEEGKTVVFLPGGKKWENGEIPPGSTVYVPRKIEKEDKVLPLVRDSVAIFASLAAITVSIIAITR